jgi:hypothetical protein
MAHGSGKRLLLSALVKGLGEAVRCNDQSAAERYRGRLRLAAEQIAADDPVRDALGRLLLLSSLWIGAAAADRDDDTKQQMLEVIERVIWLLTS